MEGVSPGGAPRSPRIPEITDRLKSGPIPALRAIFAGIGKIVMAAERAPEWPDSPSGPPEPPRWRSLDLTGNVRLLSPEDMADDLADGSQPADGLGPAVATAPHEPAVAAAAGPDDMVAELPIPAYDTLSLPSIRARLRGLNPAQLRELAGYERAHAGRPDVLGMLERRIVKLETAADLRDTA